MPTMISTLPIMISTRASLDPVRAVVTGLVVVVVDPGTVVVVVVVVLVDVVVDVVEVLVDDVVLLVDVVVVVDGVEVLVGTGGPPDSTIVVSGGGTSVVSGGGGGTSVVVEVLVVELDDVVVELVVVELVVVSGTVVDVVVPGTVVVGTVVVGMLVVDAIVVVGGGVVSHTLDSTNFTLPSGGGGGVTSANEPAATRSDAVKPSGIRTNTLSRWPLLRMIWPSENVRNEPAIISEIDSNEYTLSFGAMTKCQLGPASVSQVPDSALSLWRSITPTGSTPASDRWVMPTMSSAAPSSVSSAAHRTSLLGRSDASVRPSFTCSSPGTRCGQGGG